MDHTQGYSWDQICPPTSPSIASNGSYSIYGGSSTYGTSPVWATSSLASSPSPATGSSPLPSAQNTPVPLTMDYYALINTHLPGLYQTFHGNPVATQNLELTVNLIAQGIQPDGSILNNFVISRRNGYYCSVGNCDRHTLGWLRSDRAREHFLTDHLCAHYACTMPGCQVKCKRLADFKDHLETHNSNAPRYYCDYCPKHYPKKGNLNRHIEKGHKMDAPRRIRGIDRPARY